MSLTQRFEHQLRRLVVLAHDSMVPLEHDARKMAGTATPPP